MGLQVFGRLQLGARVSFGSRAYCKDYDIGAGPHQGQVS